MNQDDEDTLKRVTAYHVGGVSTKVKIVETAEKVSVFYEDYFIASAPTVRRLIDGIVESTDL